MVGQEGMKTEWWGGVSCREKNPSPNDSVAADTNISQSFFLSLLLLSELVLTVNTIIVVLLHYLLNQNVFLIYLSAKNVLCPCLWTWTKSNAFTRHFFVSPCVCEHLSFTYIHTRVQVGSTCDDARWQRLIARWGSYNQRLIKASDNVKVYVCWETRGWAFCIPPAITHYYSQCVCVCVCAVANVIHLPAPWGEIRIKGQFNINRNVLKVFSV